MLSYEKETIRHSGNNNNANPNASIIYVKRELWKLLIFIKRDEVTVY